VNQTVQKIMEIQFSKKRFGMPTSLVCMNFKSFYLKINLYFKWALLVSHIFFKFLCILFNPFNS